MLYRDKILSKAKQAVKSREQDDGYGKPINNFVFTASYYQAHLGVEITPFDVGAMFILSKLSRLQSNPYHEDSWADIAGYAAITAEAMKDIQDNGYPQQNQSNIVHVQFDSDFSEDQ
jgi:hypothetical protein